jgi:hypothetical protein
MLIDKNPIWLFRVKDGENGEKAGKGGEKMM